MHADATDLAASDKIQVEEQASTTPMEEVQAFHRRNTTCTNAIIR